VANIQNPWKDVLDERLADGEWHDCYPIIAAMARRVPPGVAVREQERSRVRSSGTEVRRRKRSTESIVAMGQYRVAIRAVSTAVMAGRLEADPYPVPHYGWRQNLIRLRDPRALEVPLSEYAKTLGIRPSRAVTLVNTHDVPYRLSGTVKLARHLGVEGQRQLAAIVEEERRQRENGIKLRRPGGEMAIGPFSDSLHAAPSTVHRVMDRLGLTYRQQGKAKLLSPETQARIAKELGRVPKAS